MSRRGTYPGGKAGLTITDTATRNSIASGKISSTYIDQRTGETHNRGVVQLDAVNGSDLSYVNGGGNNAVDLSYLGGYYTSPNNGSHSSHTTGIRAGTMTVPMGAHAATVTKRISNKLGMIGILALAFIAFFIIERK